MSAGPESPSCGAGRPPSEGIYERRKTIAQMEGLELLVPPALHRLNSAKNAPHHIHAVQHHHDCDALGVEAKRPETPMTPASEMCFELRQLEASLDPDEHVDLCAHVKVCLVELLTLVPYQHVLEDAAEQAFARLLQDHGIDEAKRNPLTEDESLALTCRSAADRGHALQDAAESRGVALPWGDESDEAGTQTVCAADRLRDTITSTLLGAPETSLEVSPNTLDFLRRLQSKGVQLGLVSAFPYVTKVLERVKVAYLFQSVVTEEQMWELRHRPGPFPDALLRSCADLGAGMGEAIVLEASGEGVLAAREGNFGLIIAVITPDQSHPPSADMVTYDANGIALTTVVEWFVKGVQKDSWNLQYSTYTAALELQRETLTTVGNGYISSRGCFELCGATRKDDGGFSPVFGGGANKRVSSVGSCVSASGPASPRPILEHYPGHYINGVYSRKTSTIEGGGKSKAVENTDLVNCPNWAYLRVAIGEDDIRNEVFTDPLGEEIIQYTHQLNIKDAVVERSVTYRDRKGRISRVDSHRLVSMDLMHIASLSFTFQPLNYSDTVMIRSGIDGSVTNSLVSRYAGLESKHLNTVAAGTAPFDGNHGLPIPSTGHTSFFLLSKVDVPETHIAMACKNVVSLSCQEVDKGDLCLTPCGGGAKVDPDANPDLVYEDFTAFLDHNVEAAMRLDKIVSVFTSRDVLPKKTGKDGSVASYLQRASSRDVLGGAAGGAAAASLRAASICASLAAMHGPTPRQSFSTPTGAASLVIPADEVSSDGDEESSAIGTPQHTWQGLAVDDPSSGRSFENVSSMLQSLILTAFTLLGDLTTFHRILDPHRQAWQDIWDASDIQIEGDRASQRVSRLHVYHLNVTASAHLGTLDAGFLARGLHGEGYRGHVFWDELHAFPFYIATQPDICKAHLEYRLNRLRVAQAEAKRSGFQGAMFPWQTADTGREVTQSVHFNPYDNRWHDDFSFRQRHVNIAVFYDTWLYLRSTPNATSSCDARWRDSLRYMMLEIALFWSSICVFDEGDGRYHIRGVMGPDEFHEGHRLNGDGSVRKDASPEGVDDNAYTNLMVVWLLDRALDIIRENENRREMDGSGVLSEDLEEDTYVDPTGGATSPEGGVPEGSTGDVFTSPNPALSTDEYPVELWTQISQKMFLSVREDGVIEQFSGFFGLEELKMTKYKHRVKDLGRMDLLMQAEDKEAGQFQLLKQADSLLLWHLLDKTEVFQLINRLGYGRSHTARSLLRKNYDFYVPRTMDGSSLSLLVHAHLASELSETDDQWAWFTEASRTDIYNRGGTTREGIHCSVMAGSLSYIYARFAGIREIKRGPSPDSRLPHAPNTWCITPNLPSHWSGLTLRKKIRGYDYHFTITATEVKIHLEGDLVPGEEPVTFKVGKSTVKPGSWCPIKITTDPLCKIKDFYELMHQTWHHRKVMCYNYFMGGILCDRKQLEVLRHVHKTLSELPKFGGKAKLLLAGRTHIDCDLSYEIDELAKDLMMLTRGEDHMVDDIVRSTNKDFDMHIGRGVAFLEGVRFRSWITDRDGTTNNYCGRYNSSVQSIHNSIWITRFALCCGRALCITSAPLANPGIVNVSVNYEPAFVYSGSKGKEYLDGTGQRRSFPITDEEHSKMQLLNKRLSELCKRAEYTKFTLIGSGLQLKFAQTTVARQDICNSIKRKDSEEFLDTVRQLCEEVSPNGFEIIDTNLDIEIMPLSAKTETTEVPDRGFDKGDGLKWLGSELNLDLTTGPNLITGDTSGDLPMLREAMRQCPEATYAIFVTEDAALSEKVHAMCPNSLIVPSPDILCYILSESAKRYVKEAYPDDVGKLFPL